MKGNRQGFLSRFIRAQTNHLHRLCVPLGTKKKMTPMGVFFFLVRVVIQNFLKKPVISTVFKADE